jgi:hypothetical protein
MGTAKDDFELSREGWELYHRPRMQRANWAVAQPERFPDPGPSIPAAEQPNSPTNQGDLNMRGLKRLAGLTERIMKQIDDEADAVANEITAAHGEAKSVIGEFRGHAGEIKKVAADVRQQLGQLSNIPPSEGSEG